MTIARLYATNGVCVDVIHGTKRELSVRKRCHDLREA